ncbi:EAL and HDOD domain-containing protein [Comamonas sp.]|uniref:EAL and HDOD domain-containing protein n=1 Tax=Comamonas sp. TaxID=34028 RepID=UPI003A947855
MKDLLAPSVADPAPASLGGVGRGMIARQAIVNSQQSIVGYELFNRSRAPYGHTAASDVTLIFTALSHAGEEDLVGTKLMFVNCTHESLSGDHLDLLPPDKVVLEIPPLGHAAVSEVNARLPQLQSLRARGFHLAFNQTVLESAYTAWRPLADYIKLDLSVLAPDQLTVLVKFANRHSQAELIAEKVENAQQYQLASSLGIELFQGFWFARPTVMQTRLLTPSQKSIIQLITLAREQASTEAIEEVLKKDAGLAFNLLRLINSAGFGMPREITSFRQAVMIMGTKKLYRWAAMLLTASRESGAPPAVGQTSVVRGRLMELLSIQSLSDIDADQAFVAGMFSMLDRMLGIPLQSAMALIPVPENVAAAVLRQEGVLGELLTLAQACESHDNAACNEIAQNLQLNDRQINCAHLQAVAWTDQVAVESL